MSTAMVSENVTDIDTEVTELNDPLMSAIEELKKRERDIESLKKELAESKESEKAMTDLLLAQTMELEKTKVSLEESKEEIKILLENQEKHVTSSEVTEQSSISTGYDHSLVESLENELRSAKEDLAKAEEKAESLAEQVNVWKNELMNTMEAEENNKKAMDGLAQALQEVIAESTQTKDELSSTKTELETAKKEVGELKAKLKKAEEKCLDERKEADRQKNIAAKLRIEADETLVSRNDQAAGFVECIKKMEFERNFAQAECKKLQESLKEAGETISRSKEEIQRLRDIMKQALTEANVAKEAASIAREENSQLKDVLAQKEEALKLLYQESERRAKSKARARSRSPARKAALMTMKQYSEIEDSEQGKEHNDHDKESEQPTFRPRRSPSPLPMVRRPSMLTMRQYSELENSEQGKEHIDHDKESEQPTLRPRRSPSPLLMVRKAAMITMKQHSEMEVSDHDKESEQPAPKPRRPPSTIPPTLTTVRMSRSMTNLKECPVDSANHDKEHKDHDKESEQPDPRPLGPPLQIPATLSTAKMTRSMTNLKECSGMEDPEQGKKPMDSAHHDKEHNDHDKESEQPDPRPLVPPLPLPATLSTESMTNLKECSGTEDPEQGKKPMDSAHHDKEQKDDNKESEQQPTPSRSPSPSPATMTAMECSEIENSEHGKQQKSMDSAHHDKEQNDSDQESEQPEPKPSPPPLPATMPTNECSEKEDSEQDKKQKPIDSTHHDKEQKDDDKESEQQPTPTPLPATTTTTTNEWSEIYGPEQGKKPMDSAHHDNDHTDHYYETTGFCTPLESLSPLRATTPMEECLEMEDSEQYKEHKEPTPTPSMDDDEVDKLQKPIEQQPTPTPTPTPTMDPTHHNNEMEQPSTRLQWRMSLSRAKRSMSLTMKEFLAMENPETAKVQNPPDTDPTHSKPVELSSSSMHPDNEPKEHHEKEPQPCKRERLKPFNLPTIPNIPTNSCLVINFPPRPRGPEDQTRIPHIGSDDGSDSDEFDPLKGSIFDMAETPKDEVPPTLVPSNKASFYNADDELTNGEEGNHPESTSTHGEEEADRTRTRRFISKIGGLIGVRSFYYRREPTPLD
ncbi:hypothetical protein HRI_003474500 [Hibiscus trionum]|uniref:Uncharacterized protein n=1 Tax=Hibiscus trionum TaxID=183268 RepID=A0A9W7IJZ6_HIBTR|nr:hypothetical protein HRI_003474500 [Hibiscus trionum]